MKKIYQKLYDETNYGRISAGRCPSYRHLKLYEKWLVDPICDLGCGSGDTVNYLSVHGYDIQGYDFIQLNNNCIYANITKPMNLKKYTTAMCFDVAEHLTDKEIKGLFKNIKQCKNIIISVSNTDSVDFGTIDLHINKKTMYEWDKIIVANFKIIESFQINPNYKIYRCEV